MEMLSAFATGLTEAAFSAGFKSVPPLVVILDVEVAEVQSARQLAGAMAAKSRTAIVLRAITAKDKLNGLAPRFREGRLWPGCTQSSLMTRREWKPMYRRSSYFENENVR